MEGRMRQKNKGSPSDLFDEELVVSSLQKTVRGTGIIFVGTLISMGLGFITTSLIARYLGASEYGVYSLVLTVFNLAVILASFGMLTGIPREVSRYMEEKPEEVSDLTSTSFYIMLISSIIFFFVFLALGEWFSRFFNEEGFFKPFIIMLLSLPFIVSLGFLGAITRGFGRVRESVYFSMIMRPLLFFLLILVVFLVHMKSYFVYVAYVSAAFLTPLVFMFDIKRTRILNLKPRFNRSIAKNIVLFSTPLFFSGILGYLMTWMDTLMLGFYKSSATVGLYNAAAPFGRILPIFLSSFGFLYNPIATSLYVKNHLVELKRFYQMITKWVFLLTLPLFTILFIFPNIAILFIFGREYLPAADTLRLLSLGFMFHTFLGLNGLSLVVIGKPKLNMYGNIIAVILNLLLNMILIPKYGLLGAAIATSSAYLLTNIFRSFYLYRETKVHPFSLNYLKPLVISFTLLLLLGYLDLKVDSIWYALVILVVFLIIYAFLVLLSRSIDREDVRMLTVLEEKIGINIYLLKRILTRFI